MAVFATEQEVARVAMDRDAAADFPNVLLEAQWRRGSIHVTLGRMTFDDRVALIAARDDTHLDQLKRAVEGRP
jgi:hypothetical protein